MFEFTGNIGDTVVRTADLTRWKIVHREAHVLTMSPCGGDSANVITVDLDDARTFKLFADEDCEYVRKRLEYKQYDATGLFFPYGGNNHLHIAPSDVHRGGSVSFKRHLGKPLSKGLWEDLYERLGMTSLRVYRYNDCQWTDGRFSGAVDINLDEQGNVADIKWSPPWTPATRPGGQFTVEEKLGATIGHTKGLERADFS